MIEVSFFNLIFWGGAIAFCAGALGVGTGFFLFALRVKQEQHHGH